VIFICFSQASHNNFSILHLKRFKGCSSRREVTGLFVAHGQEKGFSYYDCFKGFSFEGRFWTSLHSAL
jgi:hypothetical protein